MNFIPPWLNLSLRAAFDPTGAYTPAVLGFEVVAGLIVFCLLVAGLMLVIRRTKGDRFSHRTVYFLAGCLVLAASSLVAAAGMGVGSSIYYWIPLAGTAAVLLALLVLSSVRAYFALGLGSKVAIGTLVVIAVLAGYFAPQGGLLVQKLLLFVIGAGLLIWSMWRMSEHANRGFWVFISLAATMTIFLPRTALSVAAGMLPGSMSLSALAATLLCLKWAALVGMLIGLGIAAMYSPTLHVQELSYLARISQLLGIAVVLTVVAFSILGLGEPWLSGRATSGLERMLSGLINGGPSGFTGWLDGALEDVGSGISGALRNLGDGITSGFRRSFDATPLK